MNPAMQVTWVKVQHPTLDLLGLLVGSLELTGVFAVIASILGLALGLAFIMRKRLEHEPGADLSIQKDHSLEGEAPL